MNKTTLTKIFIYFDPKQIFKHFDFLEIDLVFHWYQK